MYIYHTLYYIHIYNILWCWNHTSQFVCSFVFQMKPTSQILAVSMVAPYCTLFGWKKKNNEVPMKSQFTPDMDRKCYNMLQPHGCGSPGISHDFTLYGVNAPFFSCRNPHHHGFACSDHINETKIAAAATQQAVHGMGISCPSWASCNWWG